MPLPCFAFLSDNLPKIKAKQLSNAFPYIKLSAAQEVTAQALGYMSWYQCIHRDRSAPPSAPDQIAGLPTRIERYFHQATVLMGIGIPPGDADRWVRAWGLTGEPTLAPLSAIPTYYAWAKALERLDCGEISSEQLVNEFGGDAAFSKHPDVDQPQRVCQGVILGPMGKYPHYAVDHQVNARIPAYFRSPNALYHLEDSSDILGECVSGFSSSPMGNEQLRRLNAIQHEWHFGGHHPYAPDSILPSLISSALARPNAMIVISLRTMPRAAGKVDFGRYALACLSGTDFAAFLKEKGALNPAKVVWYSEIGGDDIQLNCFESTLMGDVFREVKDSLPVFEKAHLHKACLPVYSYPFKEAPMSDFEYSSAMEQYQLLPLAENYDDGDDDDDSVGDLPVLLREQ